MKAKSRKSKRAKLQGMGSKRGLDLSPEEAHRLWGVTLAGKEFGAIAYVYGVSDTGRVNVKGQPEGKIEQENKARRKVIGNFLRSWADNIEGKA